MFKYAVIFVFAFNVVFAFKTSRADANDCRPYIGQCEFYLCQEQNISCGEQGYYVGYGYKYCSKSKEQLLPQMFTQQGQSWVTKTFECLQTASAEFTEMSSSPSCSQIKQAAYNSHPKCYFDAGFCDLSLVEQALILNTIRNEIFTVDAMIQGLRLMKMCEEKLLNDTVR